MNIIEAIYSPKLFKNCFKDISTWSSWLVLLKALFALKMTREEFDLYQSCTGGNKAPESEVKEVWAIVGRRGGKSFVAAIIAVFLALFYAYEKHLGPGEIGTIQIIASDRSQAKTILDYIRGILRSNPVFAQYIINDLRESIELSNRILIEVVSCSFKSVRGRTVVCAIFDELAFWMTEGSNPDSEILSAVRPSMATIPNSKLIVISSPYAQFGALWEAYKTYFGTDHPEVLVWRSDTRTMNPTISQDLIDRETAKDPISARSEWGGFFREDLELFLSREAVEACCTLAGVLAPRQTHAYRAFTDPSGGKHDDFTLGIGHGEENRKVVVDLLRSWSPPFDPSVVTKEIADILKQYRMDKVTGDRYSAGWVESSFQKQGVKYEFCEKAKSDLYLTLEGFINTQMIELPNDKKLITELTSLERRRGKSGRDFIDHGPRGSDDRANSIAGLCYEGMRKEDLLFPNLRCGVDYESKNLPIN